MSAVTETGPPARDISLSVDSLRFTVLTTRNFVFMIAVIAMNYTISRPSPVDLLYITSFLFTVLYIAVSEKRQVTRRAVFLTLLVGTWAVSYTIASLPHFGEEVGNLNGLRDSVNFELIAKTFAISIGVISAFVSMSFDRRRFETFMKVYIASCVMAAILGTIGFVLQLDLLTWDGRARGLLDDPNMYGSFLLPSAIFCVYFLSRPKQRGKLLVLGALAIILLGVMLSFSRIAQVATFSCMFGYVAFNYRRRPQRLILIVGTLLVSALTIFAILSLVSPEFTTKFLGRFTLAEPYDLGSEGRYARYLLVLPMIIQNPLGIGVLQLTKIFPEPIHDIWLSSFVNYGWVAGFTWIILAVSSVVVSILNYRRTGDEIVVAVLIGLVGIVWCASLHEGEHWRHMWLFYGLVWGLCPPNLSPARQPPGRSAALPRKAVATQPADVAQQEARTSASGRSPSRRSLDQSL